GFTCATATPTARVADAAGKVRDGLGGIKDTTCARRGLTPASLGHGGACPAPCAGIVLFDMSDLATCALCLGDALSDDALAAAYGAAPPTVPATVPAAALACQRALDQDADILARGWSGALARCEDANASGRTVPPADCSADPDGRIALAKATAAARLAS